LTKWRYRGIIELGGYHDDKAEDSEGMRALWTIVWGTTVAMEGAFLFKKVLLETWWSKPEYSK
jgi:hypothetical protein